MATWPRSLPPLAFRILAEYSSPSLVPRPLPTGRIAQCVSIPSARDGQVLATRGGSSQGLLGCGIRVIVGSVVINRPFGRLVLVHGRPPSLCGVPFNFLNFWWVVAPFIFRVVRMAPSGPGVCAMSRFPAILLYQKSVKLLHEMETRLYGL